MAKIGTIPAGGLAVITLDHLPESIYVQEVGSNDSFEEVSNISVSQGGRQLVTLTSQERIEAASKMDILTDTNVGSVRLALGRKNGSTTLQIRSTSAVESEVFAVSSGFSEIGFNYVENSINANSNQSVSDFEKLIISTPENLERVNITFRDENGKPGFNDDFTVSELRSLAAFQQTTDTAGLVAGQLLIDGTRVAKAVLYNGGVGSVVLAIVSGVKL